MIFPIQFQPQILLYPNEVFIQIDKSHIYDILDNHYSISNYGRLFNTYYGRFELGFSHSNTIWVNISCENRILQIELDRLILMVFNYKPNYNDLYINHKDNLGLDFYLDNLEWKYDKPKEKTFITMDNGQKVNVGEDAFMAKLTEDQVREICKMLEDPSVNLGMIANKFGVNKCTIFNIKKGRTWKHISKDYNIAKIKDDLKGSNNPTAIYTEDQIHEVCRLLEENNFKSYREIELKTGVSKARITSIRRKKTWKHISDNYNIPPIAGNQQGSNSSSSKVSEEQVIKVCEMIQDGISPANIKEKLNISIDIIYNIKSRSSWKHISKDYKW